MTTCNNRQHTAYSIQHTTKPNQIKPNKTQSTKNQQKPEKYKNKKNCSNNGQQNANNKGKTSTATQNIILCHQFDLIVAQPTSELCHRRLHHPAPWQSGPLTVAIDTLACSLAAVGTTTASDQTFSWLVLRACCTYPTMHKLNYLYTHVCAYKMCVHHTTHTHIHL